MSTILKLTGLQYHDIKDIADCLVIGNGAFVSKEEAYDKEPLAGCDGYAYRVDCKSKLIGYVPLLRTLRKYYSEANSQEKQARLKDWGLACKAVRNQLAIDYANNGQERWTVKIAGILYERADKWIEFQEYSDICQSNPAEAAKWTLKQLAVRFDSVEMF